MTVSRWAAAFAVCLSTGLADARAQAANPLAELGCVYDAMTDADLAAIARAYETRGEVAEAPLLTLQRLSETCTARHGWNADERQKAEDVAVANGVVDAMFVDLSGLGYKEPGRLAAAWNALPIEDLAALAVSDWRSDAALVARLKAAARGAGVPDTETALAKSLIAMEWATMGSIIQEEWLELQAGAAAAP